jgi:phosphopantetheinyl transferase
MPIAYYRLHSSCEVALWRIEEEASFFRQKLVEEAFPTKRGDQIKHPEKALQWYASRFLLIQSYPAAIDIYKDRKPHLFNGPHISFSHSGHYVGVLISRRSSGLDIQLFDEKLLKIKDKFTDSEEVEGLKTANTLASLALIWSVKEAIFKHYGTGVPFKSIVIKSYDPIENSVIAEVARGSKTISHHLQADFIGEMSLAYLIE